MECTDMILIFITAITVIFLFITSSNGQPCTDCQTPPVETYSSSINTPVIKKVKKNVKKDVKKDNVVEKVNDEFDGFDGFDDSYATWS